MAREPNGSLVLFDWKRARKLHEKDNSFGKFMKSPVSHVPDAALFQYRPAIELIQVDFGEVLQYACGSNICCVFAP